MKFGVDLPDMGVCSEPSILASLAKEAEEMGWDGVFVWDSVYVARQDPRNMPMCDPWIAMAAMALATQRVRLGPMITPVTRRRPWKLARETVSIDHLSNGRLVLPVGLGSLDDGAFSNVNEITDRKTRAQRLDEGLEILNGLWSGEPFSYQGEHFEVKEMVFLPRPVQQPRIPIWVVGAWPRPKSMERAIRWDGILPFKMPRPGESLSDEGNALAGGMLPQDVREMKTYIDERRDPSQPFDIVLEGDIPEDRAQASEQIGQYAEAGATWWVDSMVWKILYEKPGELEPMRDIIRRGPPKI